MATVTMTVNGKQVRGEVESRTLLVEFLRYQLGLTGTHVGCDTSQCGCCVVHVDGDSVKSCTMLAVQAEGAKVITIEGLAESADKLHPMQEAFRDNHALQCGFCTPGMVMSCAALYEQQKQAGKLASLSPEQVQHAIAGNLCRCGCYPHVLSAMAAVAQGKGGAQ